MIRPHVGDIAPIILTCRDSDEAIVDISGATELSITFKKPDGTSITRIGSLLTDGTDGKLTYTFASDDLDVEGVWQVQAHVTAATWEAHSDIYEFTVDPNLEEEGA